LRSYLSIVYLGHSIRGIDQAARIVHNKNLWELDLRQNATIAAMMVYPRPQVPNARWETRVRRRAEYGLELFERLADRYKQRLE
jgi:membrane peptidoglycan carboxypeptidase